MNSPAPRHARISIIGAGPGGLTCARILQRHGIDEYTHWSPRMQQLITENDGRYIDRPLFALPVPHTWEHNPTVTLLGDAAHVMPPLGVGVNLAMLDASELALAIAGSTTVADAIRTYEQTMLPRSTEIAKLLEGGAEQLLSDDIPDFDEQP